VLRDQRLRMVGRMAITLSCIALSASGCWAVVSDGDPAPPPVVQAITHVAIIDNAFVEAAVTLSGATSQAVIWTVDGTGPHTVKWSDGTPESPRLSRGQTYERAFDSPGTYPYVCGIHGSMTGLVTVTP